MIEPNKEEFEIVCKHLKDGVELNLAMIGRIFGQPFWELQLLVMLDSKIAYHELFEHFNRPELLDTTRQKVYDRQNE